MYAGTVDVERHLFEGKQTETRTILQGYTTLMEEIKMSGHRKETKYIMTCRS